jgi:hypothetical protein
VNFIHLLQKDNSTLRDGLDLLDTEICDFLQFLNSAKFTGTESNGDRKDWIATGDVIHRLVDFRLKIAESLANTATTDSRKREEPDTLGPIPESPEAWDDHKLDT